MKFRVERDVLAEAVTWVARGLPGPPAGAGARRRPDRGRRRRHADPVGVRLRGLRQGHRRAPRSPRPARVLVLGRLLADISRNLPDRADRRRHRRHQGPGHLRLVAVQPADDAGRRLPDAARPRPSPPAPSTATCSPRPSPRSPIAADRGDTLPILTGVRVEIEGDTMTLLATDRYRLAMRELHWNPDGDRRQPRRAGPRPHPVRHRQGARRQRLGRRRARQRRRRRRPGRLRGRPAPHDHPPARRRVPQGHLDLPDQRRHRVGHRDRRRWSRRSSASPWSPSATPRCG